MTDAWPYVVMLAGAVVTYAWRGLGVALAGRIPPAGPLIQWVTCVAYALLAGLIARMIVLPIGPLAETALAARLAAAGAAVAVFFVLRRHVLAGVIAGAGTLAALRLVGWA
jgi:branched-subunit amino acid transport protein